MKTAILLLLLLARTSQACMWIDGTRIDGSSVTLGGQSIVGQLRQSMAGDQREWLQDILDETHDHDGGALAEKERSAIRLVAEEKYADAISILLEIEANGEKSYSVAANLGTTYELAGQLDKALEWIEEGVRRNPDAHMGSEWLHVLILKEMIRARDAGEKSPDSDFIVLPDHISPASTMSIGGENRPVESVHQAFLYQLGERMIFVKPKDRIVSEMLFDLAILEAETNILESAIELLDLSLLYGFRDPGLIEAKKAEYSSLIAKRERRPYIIATLVFLALVACLIQAYRKKSFFLSRAAYRKHEEGIV